MKSLLVTLGMLFFLGLSTQMVRHVYVGWIAPRTSVLDRYQDKTEKDIGAAESLDELLKQYDEAHSKFKEWAKGKTEREILKGEGSEESYTSSQKLKHAIEEWESRSREVNEIHFFWWCGLLYVGLGLVCFVRANQWLGVAAITGGLIEMIYWTSPTFRVFGGGSEFERLLFWKMVYTAVSLVLLLGLWCYFVRCTKRCALGG